MIISLKDTLKLMGITIIASCAVFVCTLFLSYNIDLAAIKNEITNEIGKEMYKAQVLTGRVVACVSGGCLVVTSIVMLFFYIKNFIDTHGKQLGILKAIGYPDIKIAKHFYVFALSVFIGCLAGYILAYLYLPTFYEQNTKDLLFEIELKFHPLLTFLLIGVPTIVFACLSILFAYIKLKSPILDLLCERQDNRIKTGNKGDKNKAFLNELSKNTLKSKKILCFFIAFSAFCFSAMVQMSMAMDELSSKVFAWMILMIGLILAFVTLFLSLKSVVNGNTKTIAIMKALGYDDSVCRHYIFGAYRPISYIGFMIGTFYQYGLLKFMVSIVFKNIEGVPEFHFKYKAFFITLIAFILTYEVCMYLYSLHIKKLSIKRIMNS